MTQVEHILKRPDTYIGSVTPEMSEQYVYDGYIQKKEILMTTGFIRIFVEIISNAIDNVWRSEKDNVKMTKIKINVDKETGIISVMNDGSTIPIVINEQTQVYNPEMIFGMLLTSSNYNDNEERLTSGRNGLGSKCTCVFSKRFYIECADTVAKKLYKQEWTNNMGSVNKPKITNYSKTSGYTLVEFLPDYTRFDMNGLTDDIVSLLQRYAIETAMITKLNVFFNNEKIPVKGLLDYAKMFYQEPSTELVYQKYDSNEFPIEVVYGSSNTGDFIDVSFVNGIQTGEGGVHVDAYILPLARKVSERFASKKKSVSTRDVKGHLRMWVNATLPNPRFNNQSKNKLIGPSVKPEVAQTVFNKVIKWEFVNDIENMLKAKEMVALKTTEKKTRTFRAIKGYDPANNNGKKGKWKDCSLILCEGLSAKTFAVKGIQEGFNGKKGRDWYGIFALKGKGLNVRNASKEAISKNKEIVDMIQILNLRFGVDYSNDENFETLNYGRVIILADSDQDGYHIVGLILNFFHFLFPSLIKRQGFIVNMCTPITKITLGKEHLSFYSLKEAEEWLSQNQQRRGIKIKYLKGLGSSSDNDIKDSFGKVVIEYDTIKDTIMDKEMNKVFLQSQTEQRKEWLTTYNPSIPDIRYKQVMDNTTTIKGITISDFLNKEMIKYSIDDCLRNIPNVFDGLKISQRKILYASFLKGREKLKVSQFAGFVSERTNYHHGEQCLFDTITKMGQDFPGSNNIPLLDKDGQYGSRASSGKDAASARYIFAQQALLARKIFRQEDDQVLETVVDDGEQVEPTFYIPIIPMILVNGSVAIATGWSTNIPSFNPKDVIQQVKNWIKKMEIDTITPWCNGHLNSIEKISNVRYMSKGKLEQTKNKYIISELPIGISTESYKSFLEDLYENKRIKSLKNYSTANEVHFEFECESELDIDSLKLLSPINLTNMVVFLENDKLKRMDSTKQIINVFCKKRLEVYKIRKEMQLNTLKEQRNVLESKCKFLDAIMKDELQVFKVKEDVVLERLKKDKYHLVDDKYDYLLNMHMRSFTEEHLLKLETELKKIISDIWKLKEMTEEKMWLGELSELEKCLK